MHLRSYRPVGLLYFIGDVFEKRVTSSQGHSRSLILAPFERRHVISNFLVRIFAVTWKHLCDSTLDRGHSDRVTTKNDRRLKTAQNGRTNVGKNLTLTFDVDQFTLNFNPRRSIRPRTIHVRKSKVIWADGHDRLQYLANVLGNYVSTLHSLHCTMVHQCSRKRSQQLKTLKVTFCVLLKNNTRTYCFRNQTTGSIRRGWAAS